MRDFPKPGIKPVSPAMAGRFLTAGTQRKSKRPFLSCAKSCAYPELMSPVIHVGCCCCRQVASVVSDSVRPHRRQPTRLLRPWDSPGKSTGVGCHCLLQCMNVKSESEVAQSCSTPSDPLDCSPPGSSVHGIFQARVLEWGAVAFSIDIGLLVLKEMIEKFHKIVDKQDGQV